jgi:XRE family transcriptional regulator, regulator of sulfur utilization
MAAVKARKKPEQEAPRKPDVARKRAESGSEPAPQRGRPRVSASSGDELGAAEVARRVADGLKHFRKVRGLSLDELAARSGVSRAALSQIEGTRTNPTLSVLWKVAVGLDVPFHELLGVSEDGGAKVLRAGDSPPLKSGDGRMESRLLSPGGSSADTEIYELRFLPKAVHRSEPHGRGTLETLVVMTGALRLLVEEAEYELLPGDTIFFKADVQHVYENRSSHETRCFNVIRYQRDS